MPPATRRKSASASPPAPEREAWKRLTPDERRAQLIAVAEELFVSRPYAEIGIAEVAKAAGITHGLIYHYFPSKEALFTAAFEARAQELLARTEPDRTLSLPAQVEHGVRGYLDFVEQHRIAYLNLFRGPVLDHEAFLRICEETRLVIVNRFLEALGIQHLSLSATRLSLRGYVGYAESVVLKWLEAPAVPRATLERLIYSSIRGSLLAGLRLDRGELGEFPVEAIFEAFDAYFET